MAYVDSRESVFHAILNLKNDHPKYYTTLFGLSRWILPDKSIEKMDSMLQGIEQVLGGDMLSIYLTLENYPDPQSFFKFMIKLEDGTYQEIRVTKFEILQKFEEIRKFIFDELKEVQKTIRFSHPTSIQPQ